MYMMYVHMCMKPVNVEGDCKLLHKINKNVFLSLSLRKHQKVIVVNPGARGVITVVVLCSCYLMQEL